MFAVDVEVLEGSLAVTYQKTVPAELAIYAYKVRKVFVGLDLSYAFFTGRHLLPIAVLSYTP